MATDSSILIWKIPWTVEPGGLLPMGLQRIGQDWPTEHNNTTISHDPCWKLGIQKSDGPSPGFLMSSKYSNGDILINQESQCKGINMTIKVYIKEKRAINKSTWENKSQSSDAAGVKF